MEQVLIDISELMQKGKAKDVKILCQQAVDDGIDAERVLKEGLLAGMDVIGRKFKNDEIFVPEVLVAARAMAKGAEALKPYLGNEEGEDIGTVIIGTVKGDLHDIGKKLVKMMMEGKGLKVIDLGVDVAAESFVEAAIENNADIISCSALLTTTMTEMENVVKAVNASDLKDKVKIMIGGAPITQGFCDNIGADCYTTDAATAAEKAVEICKRRN